MKSAPAIGFDYRPSRWLSGGLLSIAALAVLATSLCGLPGWLRVALGLLIAVCAWRAVQRQWRTPVTAVRWAGDGGWFVRYGDAGEFPVCLAFHRLLGEYLLLSLHDGQRHAELLVLAADNSDAELRRRLRVRLAVSSKHASS